MSAPLSRKNLLENPTADDILNAFLNEWGRCSRIKIKQARSAVPPSWMGVVAHGFTSNTLASDISPIGTNQFLNLTVVADEEENQFCR